MLYGKSPPRAADAIGPKSGQNRGIPDPEVQNARPRPPDPRPPFTTRERSGETLEACARLRGFARIEPDSPWRNGRVRMVYLSRIYTKSGDAGETGLGDGSRVPKDHARVTA